jgi:biotin operon repressor
MAGDKQRRVGRKQEMRALAALRQKPMTTQQLADALGLCRSSAANYIVRLRAEPQQIYVSGHEQRQGSPAPVFAVGARPDVEYLPQSIPAPKPSKEQRCAQVLKLLAEKPATARQLGPRMNVVPGTAMKYIAMLRDPANKQVFILKWLHPRQVDPKNTVGGDWAPVYAVGNKADKPKPPAETSAQRHARLHKDRDYRRVRNVERRARYEKEKLVKQHLKAGPQTWLSALMGVA